MGVSIITPRLGAAPLCVLRGLTSTGSYASGGINTVPVDQVLEDNSGMHTVTNKISF